MFVDYYIAEYALSQVRSRMTKGRYAYLIISVEAVTHQFHSVSSCGLHTHMRTVEAAIEIHTVSLSPDPPRYLRGMTDRWMLSGQSA